MNFGFNGEQDKNLVKRFSVENTMIKIELLDGSVRYICDSDENRKLVMDYMLERAKERDEKGLLKGQIIDAENHLTQSSKFVFFSSFLVYFGATVDNEFAKAFFFAMSGLTAVSAAVEGRLSFIDYKKVSELKKYRDYLSFQKQFDALTEEEKADALAKCGIVGQELNINTVDNFSRKKINNIKKNLNN